MTGTTTDSPAPPGGNEAAAPTRHAMGKTTKALLV